MKKNAKKNRGVDCLNGIKIKGVAFDLEGTLIDVEMAHHLGHIFCAHEAGVDLLGLRELNLRRIITNQVWLDYVYRQVQEKIDCIIQQISHFIGGPDHLVVEEIYNLSYKKLSSNQILEADREYYSLILKNMEICPRLGALEVIRWLKENGFEISIGSLTVIDQALYLLEKSNLLKVFPRKNIVLREDVKNLKPAPDVYLETAERMGVDPEVQLVFEDSPNGVKAARTAGVKSVIGMPVYNTLITISSLIEAGAKRVFMDWREMNLFQVIQNIGT